MKKVFAKTKVWTVLFLVIALVLGMTACGGGTTTAGAAETSAAATTKQAGQATTKAADIEETTATITEPITIEFWHNYSHEKRRATLEQIAADFNASQEYITVKCTEIGGYPVIAEQVAGALAAGTGLPAISTMNYPRVLNFGANGVAEPLNAYFDKTGTDLSDYNEGMLDGLSAEDGSIYALPLSVSGGVCIYNKSILDEIGKPFPVTWDDFQVWCKEVHEATGKIAFGFPYDFNYMNNFSINVTGKDPLGDGKVSALDDPAFLEFVYDMKELIDAGYCS